MKLFRLMISRMLVMLCVMAATSLAAQNVQTTLSSDELLKLALQETRQQHYSKAIDYCREGMRKAPADNDIHTLLGRLYFITHKVDDARQEWTGVLRRQPKNKEVLQYLVNMEASAGNYEQALQYANTALGYYAGDTVLLLKKLGLLEQQGHYNGAATMADELLSRKRDQAFANEYAAIYIAAVNGYLRNNNTTAAEQLLNRALGKLPGNEMLLNGLQNIQFKKAALLEQGGDYKAAADITENLLQAHPAGTGYRQAYIDQALAAARTALKQNSLSEARLYVSKVLTAYPGQHDALLYAITIAYLKDGYAAAIAGCDSLLHYYPADSLVLAKKAGMLAEDKRYAAAVAVSGPLQQRYPADGRLAAMCAEQWLALGRQWQEKGATDSATMAFKQVLIYAPDDTIAFTRLVSSFAMQYKPDSVLVYAGRGLQLQPGNIALLREKAVALEAKGRYTEAVAAIEAWKLQEPGNKRLDDYLLYMKNRTYRNQLGVLHLQSFYDNGTRTALISSLQYLRRFNKGIVLGRVNYGDRQSGNGVQLEAEMYYNHTKQDYSWLWLGWSNSLVFPKYRASYSFFHNFPKGWEGELGFRYLRADTINTYTPLLSVAKYIGSYWVNARGYFTKDTDKWYQAYTLTNRWYVNEQRDFLALILSTGVSPDDRSRSFQLNNLLGVTTNSVAVGYQKYFRYNTILSLYAAWLHQSLSGRADINQYDIYLSFYKNF
ncbi:YaiO family outer membrane beta-barrel protein [Filimonas lacunae]|nr:YaiO family outer membrane beta-barrel protein [Filimonas lacunae]